MVDRPCSKKNMKKYFPGSFWTNHQKSRVGCPLPASACWITLATLPLCFLSANIIRDYQDNSNSSQKDNQLLLCLRCTKNPTCLCQIFCKGASSCSWLHVPFPLLHHGTFTIAVGAACPLSSSLHPSLTLPLPFSSLPLLSPSLSGHRFRAWSDLHVMGE